ncbi:Pfam:DUF800 [Chamberlinius hualienensis]
MSVVSSPAHRLSGDYDGAHIYDPNFTADISNKMRVPHKLFATGEGKNSGEDILTSSNLLLETYGSDKVSMKVPDRIIVAGNDQHIGRSAPPRELRLEQVINVPNTHPIRVETPPRVLTLEDHTFPTVDDDEEKQENAEKRDDPRSIRNITLRDTPSMEVQLTPSSELQLMHQELSKLQRRVALLEYDNQAKSQRETVLFSLGAVYFIIKTILWFNRHW